MKPKLSVLVMVKDESARLPAFFEALTPLRLPHEVVLLDTGSKDMGPRLARSRGARVVNVPWEGFSETRNRGFACCRGDWILVLDADENPDPGLLASVERAVLLEPSALWTVNRLAYFLGRPVLHSGWHPDRHLRLFPKGWARFNGRPVHEGMESAHPGARVRRLDGLLHHHSYPDLDGYLDRMNRYTQLQAVELFQRRGSRPAVALVRMLADPPLTFLKMYILKRGFLDGASGLVLALLSACSTLCKYAKWWRLSLGDARTRGRV
ncbi:MAG: glycosyltransferase family 2 protein [bacterium]